MKIDNESFYHIHKVGVSHDHLWVPGSRFSVGDERRNGFIKYYDSARIGIEFEDSITPMSSAINRFLQLSIDIQREQFPTGTVHRGNPDNLVSDSLEHDLLREYARRYWMANDLTTAPAHEILFAGEVIVHEQLR